MASARSYSACASSQRLALVERLARFPARSRTGRRVLAATAPTTSPPPGRRPPATVRPTRPGRASRPRSHLTAARKCRSATQKDRPASSFPFEGLRQVPVAAASSPPRRPPLARSRALRSVVSSDVPGSLGCLIPPWRCRFRLAFAVFLSLPSPTTFAVGLSSRALRPSSEFSETARPSPPGAEHLPWGSAPFATSADGVHFRAGRPAQAADIPGPQRSALDVSHVLDGFLLHRPCGFVSPRCHVRGSLFRGFAPRTAARARRPPWPS